MTSHNLDLSGLTYGDQFNHVPSSLIICTYSWQIIVPASESCRVLWSLVRSMTNRDTIGAKGTELIRTLPNTSLIAIVELLAGERDV